MSVQDAVELKQKADSSVTDTSHFFGLFGSSPDHILASSQYNAAANLFKKHKQYSQASQCYYLSGECFTICGSYYLAGKAFESAAILNTKDVQALYKKASEQYILGSSPEKACQMLEKAGDSQTGLDSLKYYEEALQLYDTEELQIHSKDLYNKTISLLLKHNEFRRGIEYSERYEIVLKKLKLNTFYHRQVLCTILMALYIKDSKYAVAKFNILEPQEETGLIQNILTSVERGDQDGFDNAMKDSTVGYLDNSILKFCRNIVLLPREEGLNALQAQIEEEGYM
jgi:tetratricopeptide (TPR) repeat protein